MVAKFLIPQIHCLRPFGLRGNLHSVQRYIHNFWKNYALFKDKKKKKIISLECVGKSASKRSLDMTSDITALEKQPAKNVPKMFCLFLIVSAYLYEVFSLIIASVVSIFWGMVVKLKSATSFMTAGKFQLTISLVVSNTSCW